jgi:hypothetical protein
LHESLPHATLVAQRLGEDLGLANMVGALRPLARRHQGAAGLEVEIDGLLRTRVSLRKTLEGVALDAIVSKTGCTSVGELEMTRRISPVAVCCSSDSVTCAWASVSAWFFSCSSVNSRTFSMAMTA